MRVVIRRRTPPRPARSSTRAGLAQRVLQHVPVLILQLLSASTRWSCHFERAVEEIATITRRLVGAELIVLGPPRSREAEASKAKVRGQKRDAQMRKRLGVPEPA
jgi:hypothetical protein